MLHNLDDWHAQQAAWRIEQVLRIEPLIEGASDHTLGHDTLNH